MNTFTFVLIIICLAVSLSALSLVLYYIRDEKGREDAPDGYRHDGSVAAGDLEVLRMEVTVTSDVLVNLGRENVARIMQEYADRLKEELERLNRNVR